MQSLGCHLEINKREKVGGEEGGGSGAVYDGDGCTIRDAGAAAAWLETSLFFFFATRTALFGEIQKSILLYLAISKRNNITLPPILNHNTIKI